MLFNLTLVGRLGGTSLNFDTLEKFKCEKIDNLKLNSFQKRNVKFIEDDQSCN